GAAMVRLPGVSPFVSRRVGASAAAIALIVMLFALASRPAFPQADTAKAAAAGTAEANDAAPPLPRIVITTEKHGDIVIELYPQEAPRAVERITNLVRSGFYNGLAFHRVESYVVQTGAGDSELGPVEGEMFSEHLTHEDGMVGMARLPDDYDSARTQFYICKQHSPLMNGEYTLFGKVVQGLDIVHRIKKGDKIRTIRFVE
ncbi:MAG: peptidylprolyl isomerase, partial [Candidatus Krumholzibacteria bacterium]|nr:peptidylprolyl isomerase [Candidatus Krumholzibacteria bacterium]